MFKRCNCFPECNSIEYDVEYVVDRIRGSKETIDNEFFDEVIDSRVVVRFGHEEYNTWLLKELQAMAKLNLFQTLVDCWDSFWAYLCCRLSSSFISLL